MKGGAAEKLFADALFPAGPGSPERRGAALGLLSSAREMFQKEPSRYCASIRSLLSSTLIKYSGDAADKFTASVGGRSGSLASFAFRITDSKDFMHHAALNFFLVQLPAFIGRHSGEIDAVIERIVLRAFEVISNPEFVGRFFAIDMRQVSTVIINALREGRAADAASGLLSRIVCDVFKSVTINEALALIGADTVHGLMSHLESPVRAIGEALTENARIEADDLAYSAAVYIGMVVGALESPGGRGEYGERGGREGREGRGERGEPGERGGRVEHSEYGERGGVRLSDIFGGARRSDLGIISDLIEGSFLRPDMADALWRANLRGGLEEGRDSLAGILQKVMCDVSGGTDEREFAAAANGVMTRAMGNFDSLWKGGFSLGVSELIARSGAAAIVGGMGGIIEAVDLHGVAEERINAMDTRNIERVFRSFTGRYISRIKLYGFWGGLFGIHPAVSVITALVELIRRVVSKIKRSRGE